MREFFVGTAPHQMYVQHWSPSTASTGKTASIVMVHGGAHTGLAWTTTPDGRPGWVFEFLARGWNVYVIDWPGAGRSGTRPENMADTPDDVVRPLVELLIQVGPAALVGHSIGASLCLLAADRKPELVVAIAALAPASAEKPMDGWQPAPLDQWMIIPADLGRIIFANAVRFPQEAFDDYAKSIIPFPAGINNAALGFDDSLRTSPESKALWGKRIPTLLLAAEDDQIVPLSRAAQTSAALGVPLTTLGGDWGLPGHGHLFIVEKGSGAIAVRVEQWLAETAAALA
jgi:pimeloyl-ACP methyl ester carboxylesterase